MIARDGRDGLANVERRNRVASIGVWRGARDVTIVVQTNASQRAYVAHAIDRAHEHGLLIGNAAVFYPHIANRAHARLAARNARARNAHLIRAHAIVRDRAAEHRIRAHAECRVAGISSAAVGVAGARGRALACDAFVAHRALRLVGTLVHWSRADAAHAGVSRAYTRAVSVFATRGGVFRDAPVHRACISKDAANLAASVGMTSRVGRTRLALRAIRRVTAIHDRRAAARTARTARAARTG
jgi:hypothetical protein